MDKVQVRAVMHIATPTEGCACTYSRHFLLPEYPLVGDEMVVWNDDGTTGLIVTVTSRSWSSRWDYVELCCKHDYQITPEKLQAYGWK